MAMKHGRDHGSYRGRMHGDISESAALPTSRYGNNRESQAPRKPLNQIERPIVFSYSQQVQSVRDIIIGIHGDSSPDKIQLAANAFFSMGDISALDSDVTDVLVKAFSSLPVEIPATATLVAIVFVNNDTFMEMLTEKISANLLNSLQDGMKGVFTAKMLLRSLACLSCCGVMRLEGMLAILTTLTKIGALSDLASIEDRTRGAIAGYLLVSSLPWIVSSLTPSHADFLSLIETHVNKIITSWSSDFDMNGSRAIFQVNVTVESTEAIGGPAGCACWDNYWEGCSYALEVISELRLGTMQSPSPVQTPWLPFLPNGEANGETRMIQVANARTLPQDYCEQLASTMDISTWTAGVGTAACLSSWRNARFCIFDGDIGANAAAYILMPMGHKFLLGEYIRDILVFFEPLGLEDGTRIGSVQLAASHILSLSSLFEQASHVEFGIIEMMLTLVLQPAERDPIYLCAVLLELCKLAPSLIPPVIAAGCGILFQLTPALDTSAWRAVGTYLQLHLCNFKLAWPYWANWEEEFFNAAYAEDDAMRAFCTFVIDGCSRVTFKGSLQAALPPKLLGSTVRDVPLKLPLFAAGTTGLSGKQAVAQRLVALIEVREAADAIEDFLDNEHPGVDDSIEGDQWRGLLLMEAIVFSSDRTLSTLVGALDAYRDPLRMFLNVDGAPAALMSSLTSVFAEDGGRLNLLLDLLLRRSVLRPIDVLSWALSAEVAVSLARDPWLWAHVTLALDRAVDSVRATLSMREALYGGEGHAEEGEGEEVGTTEAMEGLPDEDDDDDDMDEGDRRSRRKQRVNVDHEAISAANLALQSAVAGCGEVCMKLCKGLIAASLARCQMLPNEDELDPMLVTAASLLRHTLRSSLAAQEELMVAVNLYLPEPMFLLNTESIASENTSMASNIADSWKTFTRI